MLLLMISMLLSMLDLISPTKLLLCFRLLLVATMNQTWMTIMEGFRLLMVMTMN
jgi:hypothetical protein